jgi:hypothetical protein
MAIRFRTSGCLFSIIASVVLTILLNLMIRGCSSASRSASHVAPSQTQAAK